MLVRFCARVAMDETNLPPNAPYWSIGCIEESEAAIDRDRQLRIAALAIALTKHGRWPLGMGGLRLRLKPRRL